MKRVFYGISKKRVLAECILVMVFSLFNSIFTTYMSRTLGLRTQPELKSAIIGLIMFLLLWLAEEFILDMITSSNKVLLENALLKNYFNKIYDIKPEVLKKNNTGYISGLLRKCTTDQQDAFNRFVDVALSLVYIIYFAIAFIQFQAWVGVVVIILGLSNSFIRVWIRRRFMEEVTERTVEAASNKDKLFIDCASNINTAQRLQARNFFNKLFDGVNMEHYLANLAWKIRDEIAFSVGKGMTFLFAPISLTLVYLLQPELINNPFCMGLIATVSIQLPYNARALAGFIAAYDKLNVALGTLDTIVNEESKRIEICTEPFSTLTIRDMEFTYHVTENDSLLIKIPKFDLSKGDFAVITGESGQGKTTLLNLMSGEIETGKVVINGTTREQRLDCVFIAQDTEMFDLSIRDNLTLGKTIADSTLYYYLDEVGMGDWLRSQPDGLDTMLGERGIFVSTGQRQRLNLIRGLLCTDKDVYLLDEPTSNVDVETEASIIDLIKTVLKGKTVVCVTHRQPIISLCTKRYVFENSTLEYYFDADCT